VIVSKFRFAEFRAGKAVEASLARQKA